MLRTFVTMRLLVGGTAFLAPGLGARLIGLPRADPQAAYWARLFGIRDVVLGVAALRLAGDQRREVIRLTALCDAVDVGSALLGRRAGFSTATTALAGVTAVAAGAVAAAAGAEAG